MNHKDLDVWKKGMDLVELIYTLTSKLPTEERYGLIAQMRLAAVSIPSNIAEGAARKSNKEFLQFISVALGSIAEIETIYLIALRLNYVEKDQKVFDLLADEKHLLLGFRNHIKKHLTTNF
ncbi:four helix bundle protein [Aureitalea sp. L0-47]|uniref:four helix bundle protein n=1 Tax=Aureitalea sp. L0-47 TaxID=2816962 RepID=UPI0022390CCD|nr:four helix bundle protein [Aureitalea sp. L0-47]MCW5519201.1 four helix bundle protein [Aureitalea sp. L0-47]